MEPEQLAGYWILEQRNETLDENDEEYEIVIHDKKYTITEPVIEVLFFKVNTNKCIQMGLELLPEDEREDFDYETSSYFPGTYDIQNQTIKIMNQGNMTIYNGKLIIKENSKDYSCLEIWSRLSDEHQKLIQLLDFELKNF